MSPSSMYQGVAFWPTGGTGTPSKHAFAMLCARPFLLSAPNKGEAPSHAVARGVNVMEAF